MLPPSIRQLLHLVSQSLTYLCACAAGKYMAGRGTWYGICQRVHVITFYDAGWMMRPSVAVVVDIGHHFRFHNIRGRGDGGVRSLACDGSGCEGVRPVCHCRLPRLAVGADCLRRPLYYANICPFSPLPSAFLPFPPSLPTEVLGWESITSSLRCSTQPNCLNADSQGNSAALSFKSS